MKIFLQYIVDINLASFGKSDKFQDIERKKNNSGILVSLQIQSVNVGLKIQAVLVGVVSRGKSCARKNSPGIYTRVKKYLNWINRITRTKGQCYKIQNYKNDPGKERSKLWIILQEGFEQILLSFLTLMKELSK